MAFSLLLLLAAQADAAAPAPPVDWDKEFGVERPAPDPVTGEIPVAPYPRSNANAGAQPFAGTAMAEAFGGQAGIRQITARLVDLNKADPRISEIFKANDTVRLKRTLYEQFCFILNAGCDYTGRDMASSHKDIGLQRADLNALVENLQRAMREAHVPFGAQNRLLAKFAPMSGDIVTR